jgi:hypothetical protein
MKIGFEKANGRTPGRYTFGSAFLPRATTTKKVEPSPSKVVR